jgi:hypothetical protein
MSLRCESCRDKMRSARRRVRNGGRRFGVEIEFITPRQGYYGDEPLPQEDVADALEAAGILCIAAGYTHTVENDAWKIVSDGSVSCGWELVSPPLTWDQRDQISAACSALIELGCDVDSQCGLHVHHEVSDLSLESFKSVVSVWHDARSCTDQLVASTRQYSEWCRALSMNEREAVYRMSAMHELVLGQHYIDRYRSLNISCFPTYGTVEMRQHQGTLDADQIIAWIAYGQALITRAAKGAGVPITADVSTLLDSLSMPEPQRDRLKSTARGACGVRTYDPDDEMDDEMDDDPDYGPSDIYPDDESVDEQCNCSSCVDMRRETAQRREANRLEANRLTRLRDQYTNGIVD